MVDPPVATEGPADPRLARSRNRLLEAAGQLLSTGGVEFAKEVDLYYTSKG